MREIKKEISGKIVTIKGWGFLTLIDRKKKVVKWASEQSVALASIIESVSDNKSLDNIDVYEIIAVFGELTDILSNELLADVMLTILENVTIDGEVIDTREKLDDYFSGESTLFYEITKAVLEVNLGDFLAKVRTWLKSEFSQSKEEKGE
jgi:hypothetical protein